MFVCEYPAVDELFQLLDVRSCTYQGVCGGVFPMAQNAEKQVVWSYAVTACPHRFFAGIVDDRIQFVRYADFHNKFAFDAQNY